MLLKEISSTHKRPVARDSEYGIDGGRYVGLHFNDETKQMLKKIVDDEQIPSPTTTDDLHITVAYSKNDNFDDYSVSGKMEDPICAKIKSFDIFPGQGGNNCLVAKLDCPGCTKLHNRTRELGANYDYDEYIPHITLSYDVGDVNKNYIKQLNNKYKGMEIYADEEYDSPIKTNWEKDMSR